MLRIVSLPPFRAAVSRPDPKDSFSPKGALGRFDRYFSALQPSPRDSFMPRDFLYFDQEQGGMVWMYALAEGLSDGGFPTADFPGGLYATYVWRDGDEAENARLYRRTLEEIEANGGFKIVATSYRDVIEEYFTSHQHLSREVEGRLIIED